MVICLERGENDLHMVQLMPLPYHHLLLHWNPDAGAASLPGCPGKEAIKRVSYCTVCDSIPCSAEEVVYCVCVTV